MVVWLLLLGTAGPMAAQDPANAAAPQRSYPIDPLTAPRPSIRAAKTDEVIIIDGRLDDAAWSRAAAATDFVQNQPRPGYAATQRTEVRILYGPKSLYVGAVLYDTNMDDVLIPGLEWDFSPQDGDVFALAIDPFLDRRNSFVFISNPMGGQRDEQTFDNSRQVIVAWEGVWTAAATLTDSAWIVEMEIPFATLRFDGSNPIQNWGINFARIVGRLNEWSYWAPLARHEILHQMGRAGDLTGLEGVQPGRNLKVKPYALGAHSSGVRVTEQTDGSYYEGGVDVKYGLTPGLTLDLTYNTDFAQVELDEEQVNLTRFSLFFPERRDFFIENQGTLSFGDVSERGFRMGASLRDFSLFHSRRVGLTASGRRIPIYGGGRMTGQVGNFNLGVLAMQTESLDSLPSENFVVARLKRNLFGRSDIGFMYINRQGGGDYNRSYGADANIRLFNRLVLNTYVAGTMGPGGASDGLAAKLGAAWRDNFWNTSFFVKQVDESFDPEGGFIGRRAMRHHYGTLGVHHQPKGRSVQEINPLVEMDYITDPFSVLETRRITGVLGVTFGSSARISAEATDRFERLREPFRIPGGVEIAAGDYSFRDAVVRYTTPNNSNLKGNASISFGGFWNGTRRTFQAGASWRPRYDTFLALSLERNNVDLPQGAFTADVAALRMRYAFNTRLFWGAFAQYNNQTDQLVVNWRGQFRYAPLSDIFLVYTEARDTQDWLALNRSVALKVTRMFAF